MDRPSAHPWCCAGAEGFAEWLMQTLPALRTEVQDAKVVFGVSVAGGVEHSTGILHDWWCGGGHPQQWGRERPSPTVASLMGLPQCRTFVLNDGTAHLVGCGRGVVPLGQVACFAIGTGVGFGLSDGEGAVVDPATPNGARSHLLRGAAVPNDVYGGVWRQWPGLASAAAKGVRARDFAGEGKPWSTPWTSLVLGARGMELAEAAFQCASPPTGASAEASTGAERAPAVEAFGQQWLHFLHTLFLPQFRNRLHGVRYLCFCGGVVDTNWPLLQQTLLQPGTALLQPLPPEVADGGSILAGGPNSKKARGSKRREARERTVDGLGAVTVLPPGPHGSGLIGAGIYALGGVGGAAQGMWAA